jgi:uncharacterized protein YcgI (DUF1989 family)
VRAGSDVLVDRVIPAREFLGLRVNRGQMLRLVDLEGQQAIDLVAFNAGDPAEKLSMVWTNVLNGRWKISTGHWLYSTRSNPMFRIVQDTVGVHFTGGGFCTAESNQRRWGVAGTRNCADNLTRALESFGIDRTDIDDACCFNVFMNVDYAPDGAFVIRPPRSRPGDHIDLGAEMDLLVGISCCPQELTPVNAFTPTPVRVIAYQPSAAAPETEWPPAEKERG